MEIKDFLTLADVILGVRLTDKTRLLRELAEHAAASLNIDAEGVAQAILAREELGSTGVGGGVAIPHARVPDLSKPFGILARPKKPIAFASVDDAPVAVVFMLLLPSDGDPEHLHALASVARAMRDPKIVGSLRAARDAGEAYRCLVSA
jgi:PTS system nitrogen regulatory IIA component